MLNLFFEKNIMYNILLLLLSVFVLCSQCQFLDFVEIEILNSSFNSQCLYQLDLQRELFSLLVLNEIKVIPNICPMNHYCTPNSFSPTPCPPNTYTYPNQTNTLDDCWPININQCGFASWWSSANQTCYPCPADFWCVNSTKRPCKRGTYSIVNSTSCQVCLPGYHASYDNTTKCIACEIGFYCSAGIRFPCPDGQITSKPQASFCVTCSSGKYANQFKTSCLDCEPGFYCSSGIMRSCPFGFYSSVKGVSICTECEPGYFTNKLNTTCALCDQSGYVCMNGSKVTCSQFGTQYYSSNLGMSACSICPNGSFVSNEASLCTACNELGIVCINGIKISCRNMGPQYYYSNVSFQATACLECFQGSYITDNFTNCYPCDIGYYCVNGSRMPCTYNTFSNISGKSSCSTCITGTYVVNSSASTICYDCLPGYFCLNGTINPCSNGYYSMPKSFQCMICSNGSYHDLNKDFCRVCEPGFFCIGGRKKTCDVGFYASNINQSTCEQCTDGHYIDVNRTSCTKCEPGFFCKNFTKISCSFLFEYANDYGSTTCQTCYNGGYLNSDNTQCLPCEPMYYCPGKWLSNSQKYRCPPKYITSEWNSTVCSLFQKPGYYYNDTLNDFILCESGYYCTNLIKYSCLPGTYAPTEGLSSCSNCDHGNFVTNESKSCTQCLQGYYCLHGDKYPCPRGYFNYKTGQSICQSCITGKYASEESIAKFDMCDPCPVNHYCVTPVSKQLCPDETISPEGSVSILNCVCSSQYECEFRKTVQFSIAMSVEDLDTTLNVNQTAVEEYLKNSLISNQEFMYNLRFLYAELNGININQVYIKMIDFH